MKNGLQPSKPFRAPTRLTTEASLAALKRHLAEPEHAIQLEDLFTQAIDRFLGTISSEEFSVARSAENDQELVTAVARRYEAGIATLVNMGLVGSYWAQEKHYPIIARAIERLFDGCVNADIESPQRIRTYPVRLFLYSLGIGAIESNDWTFLREVIFQPLYYGGREHQPDH